MQVVEWSSCGRMWVERRSNGNRTWVESNSNRSCNHYSTHAQRMVNGLKTTRNLSPSLKYLQLLRNVVARSHQDGVSSDSSVAACNRRWSVICCCWLQALEHSAWRHYICAVSTGVSTKTEDAFCFDNLNRALYYSLFALLRPVVLEVFFILRSP